MLNRKCPICGNTQGFFIKNIKMQLLEGVPLPDNYDVVSCTNCGFSFADTTANQDEYNNYYENYNMYSDTTTVRTKLINNACEIRFDLIRKYISKETNILDIGCGGGELLIHLKDNGYTKLFGIDPSAQSIEKLISEGKIQGRVGNIFSDVPIDLEEQFDLIICSSVLEHLYDIHFAIPKIQKYLKRSRGLLFLEVPAAEGFETNIAKIPNYFNHEHINYFSIMSLDNLLLQNCFERINPVNESYATMESRPPEVSLMGIYQYKKNLNKKIEKDKLAYASICNYFNKADSIEKELHDVLKNIMDSEKKIAIWGTGSYTMQILANTPKMNDYIEYFIDNNKTKQGIVFCGKKIHAPEYLLNEEDKKIIILICTMQNSEDIVKQIQAMRIENEIIIL